MNNQSQGGRDFPGSKGGLLEGDSLGSISGSDRAPWAEPGRSDPFHIPLLLSVPVRRYCQ